MFVELPWASPSSAKNMCIVLGRIFYTWDYPSMGRAHNGITQA